MEIPGQFTGLRRRSGCWTDIGRPATPIAEEQFSLLARLAGDGHPIHYDEAFAAKTRFGKRVAHGFF